MQALMEFLKAHWLVTALLAGVAGAVLFVWTHKQRLFYNK